MTYTVSYETERGESTIEFHKEDKRNRMETTVSLSSSDPLTVLWVVDFTYSIEKWTSMVQGNVEDKITFIHTLPSDN